MSDLIASLTDVIRLVGPRPYQPVDSGAAHFEREHLARGVGQAPGDFIVRRMHEGLASWRGPVLYT
jgi:hypothetical protein